MTVKTLGNCCKKSRQFFEDTKAAAKELGLDIEVTNTGELAEIAGYGVMQTPALVINEKVVSYGKVLSKDQIKALIRKAGD